MNVLYLSPHFPPNFQAFSVNLNKRGAKVLGIADVPYEQLGGSLQSALTEYYKVGNMENYDEVYRAVGFFIHKYGRIDAVESFNEYWLETEAKIRTDFNIPGRKNDDIEYIRRKSLMKLKFMHAGIPVAKGKVVRNLDEAEALAKELGYPLVIKPDKGVGAANTSKINSPEDFKRYFRNMPNDDYIAEEFIDGDIFTFDGLADAEGNIVFYASHTYESVMDLVNDKKSVYILSQKNIHADLTEIGFKTAKEFGVKRQFFHFEFFRTSYGKLIALEVNMRPPGGFMLDMCNYADDIDLYDGWAAIMTGGSFYVEPKKKYYCVFASRRKEMRKYVHSKEDILKKYGEIIVFEDSMPGILASAMGDYVYIARHEDVNVLREFIRYAHMEE